MNKLLLLMLLIILPKMAWSMELDNPTIVGNVGIGTTLANASLAVIGGNVGIGTWNPTGLLSVQSGSVLIGTTSSLNQALVSITNNSQSGNPINIQNLSSSGYEGFNLYDSGSTLAGSLQYGNSSVSGSLAGVLFMGNRETGAFDFVTGSGASIKMTLTNAGNIGIGTTVPLNTLAVVGSASIGTAASAGLTAPLNGIYASGNIISGGGSIAASQGNIGAGTSSPTALLQVGSPTTISSNIARIDGDSSTEQRFIADASGSGAAYLAANFSGSTDAEGIVTSATGIANGGSFPMVINTNSAERIRITATGNVGIGSTSPGALLDVEGTVRLTGTGRIILNAATSPSCSSCGTCSVTGSDNAFRVTVGTATTCTASFTAQYNATPSCICYQEGTATIPTCSVSTSAVTCSTVTTGDPMDCICFPPS